MDPLSKGEEREEYITSLKKTFLSTAVGIALGPICFYMTWDAATQSLIREPFALIAILSGIWAQKAIFPHIGVDPDEFESKDWLFLGFMTMAFALATWTLIIPINPIYQ